MIKLKDLLLQEKFEKISDLFMNPEYNNKTFEELLSDFKLDGGKVIGEGKFGTVLYHSSWKYVLKVFTDDVPYLKFARFVIKNPRTSFPKLFDKPRKIVPHFKRTKASEFIYIVPLEKLTPITRDEFKDIRYYLYYGGHDSSNSPKSENWEYIINTVNKIEHKYTDIKKFKEDHDFLMGTASDIGTPDISQQNIMKRSNGQIVMVDPFWEGETPYQTVDRMNKIEMDYYGYDHYKPEEPSILGGKRYKKPKVVVPKTKTDANKNDPIPF